MPATLLCRTSFGWPPAEQLKPIFFVAAVDEALFNKWQGESIPPDLEPAYRRALADLLPIVDSCERHPWVERDAAQILLAGRAAAKGWAKTAAVLLSLDSDLSCPNCGKSLLSDSDEEDGGEDDRP